MKDISIRIRILLLAISPAVVVTFILLSYFVFVQFNQLQRAEIEKIRAIADQMATISAYGVFSGNVDDLDNRSIQRLLASNKSIQAIALHDASFRLLKLYGKDPSLSSLRTAFEGDDAKIERQKLVYQRPIILNSISISDFPEIENDESHYTRIATKTGDIEVVTGFNSLAKAADGSSTHIGWVTISNDLTELRTNERKIFTNSLLLSIFIVLVAAGIASKLGTSIVKPIERITDIVGSVSDGNLDTDIMINSPAEIGMLEQGIASMADSLKYSQKIMLKKVEDSTSNLRTTLGLVETHERRYRELVENANSIILKLDLEGKITFFNEFSEKFFGFSQFEILNKPAVGTIIPAHLSDLFKKIVSNQLDTSTSSELMNITKSGQAVYVHWSYRPILDENNHTIGTICIGNDISDRHRLERALEAMSNAGSGTNSVYEDLARAICVGLNVRFAFIGKLSDDNKNVSVIAYVKDRVTQKPFMYVIKDPASLELLKKNVSVFFADNVAEIFFSDPDLSKINGRSNLGEPIRDENDTVVGYIEAIDDIYRPKRGADIALMQLAARRVALEFHRDKIAAELIQARDSAINSARVKSQFVANMSHEIRTPLNGIKGYLDLLAKTELDTRQESYIKTILGSSNSLLTVINDVLDFSKLESGKMKFTQREYSLRDCISESMDLLSPSAHEKGLDLWVNIPAEIPDKLLGDDHRLRQILLNLVGNAIKFTDTGHIEVKVILKSYDETIDHLKFSISDTGIGLVKKEKLKLFEAFSQADTTLTRQYGGTGLGLVITKGLVEGMQGTLGIKSTYRVGSCFWFEIPLERAFSGNSENENQQSDFQAVTAFLLDHNSNRRRAISELLNYYGLEHTLVSCTGEIERLARNPAEKCLVIAGLDGPDFKNEYFEIRSKTPFDCTIFLYCPSSDPTTVSTLIDAGAAIVFSSPVRGDLMLSGLDAILTDKPSTKRSPRAQETSKGTKPTNLKALVVDDNKINRELITTLVSNRGVKVTQAADGKAAIECAMSERFDIIFMDIHMPGISGIEATKAIQANSELNSKAPIIAITADAGTDRLELANCGFSEIILKPIEENLVWSIILKSTGKLHQLNNNATLRTNPTRKVKKENRNMVEIYDREKALQIAGGSEDLADKMLVMLFDELPKHEDDIAAAFDSKLSNSEIRDVVHKLHGAAAYCGVIAMQQAAKELESSLIENLAASVIDKKRSLLCKEIEKLWGIKDQILKTTS